MTYSNDEIRAAVERYEEADRSDGLQYAARSMRLANLARTALTEQADEIERLKAEVVRLNDIVEAFYQDKGEHDD